MNYIGWQKNRNLKPCNKCGRQIYFVQANGKEIKTRWTVYDNVTNEEHRAVCYTETPKFSLNDKIRSNWSKGAMFYIIGKVDMDNMHYTLYYLSQRGQLRSNQKPIKMIDKMSKIVDDVDKLLYDIPAIEKYSGIILSDDEIPF